MANTKRRQRVSDVTVENHGSLFLFCPATERVRTWLKANVDSEAQWFGGALVVEPRYAEGLAEGIREAGFSVV